MRVEWRTWTILLVVLVESLGVGGKKLIGWVWFVVHVGYTTTMTTPTFSPEVLTEITTHFLPLEYDPVTNTVLKDKVVGDKHVLRYFRELAAFPHITMDLFDAWVLKVAAEFFFEEMDYFDGAALEAKFAVFDTRFGRACIPLHYNPAFSDFHIFLNRKGPNFEKSYIFALWKKMLLTVDRTALHIHDRYYVRIHCAGDSDGDSVNLQHNIPTFSAGYLKNVLDLARKYLESVVEERRAAFQTAVTNYEIGRLRADLLAEQERLAAQLADQRTQYDRMAGAFHDTRVALGACQAKVVAQDALIRDLSGKMDRLIAFFGHFKEEAPREMLRAVLDRSGSTLMVPALAPERCIPLVEIKPVVPAALRGAITDEGPSAYKIELSVESKTASGVSYSGKFVPVTT